MIEVNLLPGAGRRASRRKGLKPGLPTGWRPKGDPWAIYVVLAWIAGPALVIWLFLGTRAQSAELDRTIQQEVADSARLAMLIESSARLRARQDTIAQKLEIIQEIDAGRYTWAHILDELSLALPEHTWLSAVTQLEPGSWPRFRIEGRAGNNFVLTRYMRNLEASPFISRVRLSSTQLAVEDERVVHAFVLEARYSDPPPELIETVPLLLVEN